MKGVIIGQLLISIVGFGALFELYASNFLMAQFWAVLIVLFGLAFTSSSLPADVELVKRLGQIVAASLYALSAITLALPLVHRLE